MRFFAILIISTALLSMAGCQNSDSSSSAAQTATSFPEELVTFKKYENNPVFSGTGGDTWDSNIRERGFILKEGDEWSLWYTGYQGNGSKFLGLATSSDGLHWERYSDKPIYDSLWVEDMYVWKEDGIYYMAAEGTDDIAHLLVSKDRIHWESKGSLDVRKKDGSPIDPGPYGTPVLWKEKGVWHLFYERNDGGIWLATSQDMITWTNLQDEPVIATGPEAYDKHAVALNQVIKYKGLYYAYYHASAFEDWREWSMNIAVSRDLINWEKYSGNPIMGDNLSSGMVVETKEGFRFYTMHPAVNVFLPLADKGIQN